MASKFFNKPQLSQTQTQQGAKTALTGIDNAADARAAQADRSIEMLSGIASKAVSGIQGEYQKNIDAKNRLESGREMVAYQQKIRSELAQIDNLESFSREDMNRKIVEMNSDFMGLYEDKPYRTQLRGDIANIHANVLNQMITSRDNLHIKKVSDATSEKSSGLAQQFAEGTIDIESLKESITGLVDDSMVAHQVPTSSELNIPDEAREKYMNMTRVQARDAVLKGIMVQAADPVNSKVAQMVDSKEFRELMGVGNADEDYNKLVAHAQKKGLQAEKFNYNSGVTSLKEKLYTSTNQGISVDIDKEVKGFKASGAQLTAQDEHKLRKEFKAENSIVVNSANYKANLLEGKDVTAHMNSKDREAVYNRAFTDTLGITESGASIDNISGSLSVPKNQDAFKDYIQSGGKIPKDVIRLFDVPAGSSVAKWDEANNAIMTMEAAAAGSGYSMESLIGVKQVSKIRGLSNLLNNDDMDEATKKNAIEAFHTRSTNFNSKGYLQSTDDTKIDTEWLDDVSRDAPWTTDDYVSSSQNADEIAGNYQAYRLAGHDESKAQSMALDLFKESNTNFEMPNGGEIVIPREHKYLNNESIIAFSKDAFKFPSIQQQRDALEATTGEGWIAEWRADRNISIQKSYNFAKTGKYDMLFDGKLVKNSSFTYSEIEDFISNTDYKTRKKITGNKNAGTFKEVERDAFETRSKRVKQGLSVEDELQHIFDLKI